jgi:hypothetical protein
MDYKSKYLKYKSKYLLLKQKGGNKRGIIGGGIISENKIYDIVVINFNGSLLKIGNSAPCHESFECADKFSLEKYSENKGWNNEFNGYNEKMINLINQLANGGLKLMSIQKEGYTMNYYTLERPLMINFADLSVMILDVYKGEYFSGSPSQIVYAIQNGKQKRLLVYVSTWDWSDSYDTGKIKFVKSRDEIPPDNNRGRVYKNKNGDVTYFTYHTTSPDGHQDDYIMYISVDDIISVLDNFVKKINSLNTNTNTSNISSMLLKQQKKIAEYAELLPEFESDLNKSKSLVKKLYKYVDVSKSLTPFVDEFDKTDKSVYVNMIPHFKQALMNKGVVDVNGVKYRFGFDDIPFKTKTVDLNKKNTFN